MNISAQNAAIFLSSWQVLKQCLPALHAARPKLKKESPVAPGTEQAAARKRPRFLPVAAAAAVWVAIAQAAADDMRKHLIIATRGSQLALWQANYVKEALEKEDPACSISLNVIKTKGDLIADRPLSQVGGKSLFVKEIEEALLSGRADLAVHSMKDIPTQLPEGLIIGCVPKREVSSDCFLSVNYPSLESLPIGATVGTSSLRRQAELLNLRPDLRVISLRGNIDTRLRKMEDGVCDAIILATAGLYRLDLTTRYMLPLPEDVFVPAVGQGALGIECLEDNYELLVRLSYLENRDARVSVAAERAFLTELDGNCQIPIGAHAFLEDEETARLTGLIASPDGKMLLRETISADASLAEETGKKLARDMLKAGGNEILAALR